MVWKQQHKTHSNNIGGFGAGGFGFGLVLVVDRDWLRKETVGHGERVGDMFTLKTGPFYAEISD